LRLCSLDSKAKQALWETKIILFLIRNPEADTSPSI